MGYFNLDYCCFCVDLRFGCIIIGCINLLVNIVLEVFACFGIEGGVLLQSLNLVGVQELSVALIVTNCILIIIISLFIAFTCLLLYGILKNKRSFVKIYLIYALIFLLVYALTFFVLLGNGITGVGDIIVGVITICLNIYFDLVIKGFYDVMETGEVQVSFRA